MIPTMSADPHISQPKRGAASRTASSDPRDSVERRMLDDDGSTGSDEVRSPRILIVDDDPEIRLALETYFEMEDYEVTTADDGARALDMMADDPDLDLVLLDVVLPQVNGFEVLQKSEALGYTAPVLMMSGQGDQENILKGFGLGAQDYIVKPFEPAELFERTEALIGRDGHPQEELERYEIGSYVIDFPSATIIKGDRKVEMTELELDILRCLVKNRGCVVTKKRLLRDAWHIDDDLIAYTINPDIAVEKIERHVRSIRRKIEPDPSRPRFIHTVYGLGYRFKA